MFTTDYWCSLMHFMQDKLHWMDFFCWEKRWCIWRNAIFHQFRIHNIDHSIEVSCHGHRLHTHTSFTAISLDSFVKIFVFCRPCLPHTGVTLRMTVFTTNIKIENRSSSKKRCCLVDSLFSQYILFIFKNEVHSIT